MTPTLKKTLVVLFILALGGVGYYYFSSGTTPVVPAAGEEAVGSDIVSLAARLRSVSIDPTFFASPLMTNLKDITVTVVQEAQGKPNPFAPIGQ